MTPLFFYLLFKLKFSSTLIFAFENNQNLVLVSSPFASNKIYPDLWNTHFDKFSEDPTIVSKSKYKH